ncbi:3'-5' exonuclease [Membranihabitans marinus]|uniref:3'-5' exonuclease n=1 Tax=Membranihabitans marinus TaxID=1227546 RepID=UPI001F1C5B84|nr:3'-5' exonuclease [Membranihabitans marinus]
MERILIDIEATCWDGYHSNSEQEIIEIAGIKLNAFSETVDTFTSLVQPVINPVLSFYCKNLTQIRQSDIYAAPVFEEVYEDFMDWADINQDTYFVSWGDFDRNIFNIECERAGYFYGIDNHIDLRKKYAELKGVSERIGLQKALEFEELDFDGQAHRAYPDTYNMQKIYHKYLGDWTVQ